MNEYLPAKNERLQKEREEALYDYFLRNNKNIFSSKINEISLLFAEDINNMNQFLVVLRQMELKDAYEDYKNMGERIEDVL